MSTTRTSVLAGVVDDSLAQIARTGRRPRTNHQTQHTSVVEDPDAKRVWKLTNHSVRCLQPGDMIPRVGRLLTVVDVVRFKTSGVKRVDFDHAPSMVVTEDRWDGVDVTIYRPRAGF